MSVSSVTLLAVMYNRCRPFKPFKDLGQLVNLTQDCEILANWQPGDAATVPGQQ